jgi:hypothetical protein
MALSVHSYKENISSNPSIPMRYKQKKNDVIDIDYNLLLSSSIGGVRPIGAVVYMQRNNLKMCLRSIDGATDTSEVAKVCIIIH